VLEHGDLSVLSFHATKVFNTFEGGAIVCRDAKTKVLIDHLKNFGFIDEVTVVAPGINGKMSEFNAALGVLQLKHIGRALERRKQIDNNYRTLLKGIKGIHCVNPTGERVANYAYFPVLVEPDYPCSRDALFQRLRDANIYARRYFYPLISVFPMYRGLPSARADNLANASSIAAKVICLPIHPSLTDEEQLTVVNVLR
jgi:dTDP-4-amino-4,6-dideoxygalactose transaminase